jgi:uncharacterized protein
MLPRLLVLIALVLPQSTPSGGAIAKFVPPVPTPASFISDARKVLTPAGHQELDSRIRAIQSAGRGDIAVAIVPSIGDYSPNQVGVEIYRTWKVGAQAEIGSARRHLGVLILIVPKELSPNNRGECWVTTGLGAEGMITDAFAGSVCRDSIIPHLRTRDYDGGVRAGIVALDARLSMDPALAAAADSAAAGLQPETTPSEPPGFFARWTGRIIGGAVAGFILILTVGRRVWRRRPRKCKRCGRRMVRLDESADDAHLQKGELDEEKLKSVDYDVWACACGNVAIFPWRNWFSGFSKCRECKRLTAKSRRRVIQSPTYSSHGLAEDTYNCKSCGATWREEVHLPMKTRSSSSGGSSGGGGGGSFGGSGSTSGGGGGSSY